MKILITGGLGQLGRALQESLGDYDITSVDLPKVDVTVQDSINSEMDKLLPQMVIHAAAYTDVEGSARNPDEAYRVNALGALNVARACAQFKADMVHLSTNEVFSGNEPHGYEEWRPLAPTNPYGRSKAAGEVFVRQTLDRYFIVRTAWLYAAKGGNFIHAILNRARQGKRLRVVVDEIGNPTYARDLAGAIRRLILSGRFGIYHFTNSGACSRWAFAREILRLSGIDDVPVVPILAGDYPRKSIPPTYGALINTAGLDLGIELRPWKDALADHLRS